MMRLQRCAGCDHAQYPPREVCGACLSGRLIWDEADAFPARVVARAVLHHSNEPRFRARLPLTLGLVQFNAGPIAVCFLSPGAAAGDMVRVRYDADGLLTGTGDDDGGA